MDISQETQNVNEISQDQLLDQSKGSPANLRNVRPQQPTQGQLPHANHQDLQKIMGVDVGFALKDIDTSIAREGASVDNKHSSKKDGSYHQQLGDSQADKGSKQQNNSSYSNIVTGKMTKINQDQYSNSSLKQDHDFNDYLKQWDHQNGLNGEDEEAQNQFGRKHSVKYKRVDSLAHSTKNRNSILVYQQTQQIGKISTHLNQLKQQENAQPKIKFRNIFKNQVNQQTGSNAKSNNNYSPKKQQQLQQKLEKEKRDGTKQREREIKCELLKIQNQMDSGKDRVNGTSPKLQVKRKNSTRYNYNKIKSHFQSDFQKTNGQQITANQQQDGDLDYSLSQSESSNQSSKYTIKRKNHRKRKISKQKRNKTVSVDDLQSQNQQFFKKNQVNIMNPQNLGNYPVKSPRQDRNSLNSIDDEISADNDSQNTNEHNYQSQGLFRNMLNSFGQNIKQFKRFGRFNSEQNVQLKVLKHGRASNLNHQQDGSNRNSEDAIIVDPGATGGTQHVKDSQVSAIKQSVSMKDSTVSATDEQGQHTADLIKQSQNIKNKSLRNLLENSNSSQRQNSKKWYLIYPDNWLKDRWDILVTIILVFSCVLIPYQLAYQLENDDLSLIISLADIFFFVDIILNFLTVYYDEDYIEQDNLKLIAKNYLQGWFTIDFLATFPIEIFLQSQDVNGLFRFVRMGRIQRLVKLVRLLRFLKIVKKKNNCLSMLTQKLRLGSGFDRLFLFIVVFLILCHTLACLFVIQARLQSDDFTDTWMEGYVQQHKTSDIYAISFYWAIQTITTVGYGDISATNTTEYWFCSAIMIVGVISFSFANSALGLILSQMDKESSILQEKIAVLDKINTKFNIPIELYIKCKKNLEYAQQSEYDELHKFLDELPHKLKIQISLYIYQERYKRIRFFQDKSSSFISWICPLMRQQIFQENYYIYNEEDGISQIYFLFKGQACFVLPQFKNVDYIVVGIGDQFGIIDIFGSSVVKNFEFDQWTLRKDLLQRQFTVMAKQQSEVLGLSISDLARMRKEFFDCYDELFKDCSKRLSRAWQLKIRAMKSIRKQIRMADQNQELSDIQIPMNTNSNQRRQNLSNNYNLMRGATMLSLRYDGAKNLHQIDEQTLEDEDTDSSVTLSDEYTSSLHSSDLSSSSIDANDDQQQPLEFIKQKTKKLEKQITKIRRQSSLKVSTKNLEDQDQQNQMQKDDHKSTCQFGSSQKVNGEQSSSQIDEFSHFSNRTKTVGPSQKSLSNVFKLGIINAFNDTPNQKQSQKSKDQDKVVGESPGGFKEITADNILHNKKQKNDQELLAEGKNILNHLSNFQKHNSTQFQKNNASSSLSMSGLITPQQRQTMNHTILKNQGQLLAPKQIRGNSSNNLLNNILANRSPSGYNAINEDKIHDNNYLKPIMQKNDSKMRKSSWVDLLQFIKNQDTDNKKPTYKVSSAQLEKHQEKNQLQDQQYKFQRQKTFKSNSDMDQMVAQNQFIETQLDINDQMLPDIATIMILQKQRIEDQNKLNILTDMVQEMKEKQDKSFELIQQLVSQKDQMMQLIATMAQQNPAVIQGSASSEQANKKADTVSCDLMDTDKQKVNSDEIARATHDNLVKSMVKGFYPDQNKKPENQNCIELDEKMNNFEKEFDQIANHK